MAGVTKQSKLVRDHNPMKSKKGVEVDAVDLLTMREKIKTQSAYFQND